MTKAEDITAPDEEDHWVIFGDKLFSQLISHDVNYEKETVTITMKPTKWMSWFHKDKMQDGYDEMTDTFTKEYPLKYYSPFPHSHIRFSGIYMHCDWNGNESDEFKIKLKELTDKVAILTRQVKSSKILMAALQQHNQKFAEQPMVMLRKTSEMLDKMKAREEDKKKDDEEGE